MTDFTSVKFVRRAEFSPFYMNEYSVSELRAILKEKNIKPKPRARRVDLEKLVLEEYISHNLTNSTNYSANIKYLKEADQVKYDELLQKYQESSANLEHCGLLQSKLTDIKEQHEEKIAEVKNDSSLDAKEKAEVVQELQSVVDKIEPEIASLQQAAVEHQHDMVKLEEEHAMNLPPEAPPLLLPELIKHQVLPTGESQIFEAKLQSEIVEEKHELNELQRALANLKKPKPRDTLAAVKESENALLLRLITEGKTKLKKTVQIKREYEADISPHGLLMAQLRNGIHLRKVERKAEAQVAKAEEKVVEAQEKVVEVKHEEEDTSMFGGALHMLGFGRDSGPQTRHRTRKSNKSAKKATRKRVSAKKSHKNKKRKH